MANIPIQRGNMREHPLKAAREAKARIVRSAINDNNRPSI
jgi:hypothetical protein